MDFNTIKNLEKIKEAKCAHSVFFSDSELHQDSMRKKACYFIWQIMRDSHI